MFGRIDMFTGKTIIGDLLDKDSKLEQILLSEGMHCLGCPAARSETLEEACEAHGINLEGLLSRLNTTK